MMGISSVEQIPILVRAVIAAVLIFIVFYLLERKNLQKGFDMERKP